MIGQRIDVGNLRIADDHVDETGISTYVLRLADRHRHHDGATVAADLDRSRLRVRVADDAQDRCRHGNGESDRKIAQPVAMLRSPVRRPPAKTDANFIVFVHDTLPTP